MMTSRPSHHALWTHSVHVIRSTEQSCGRGGSFPHNLSSGGGRRIFGGNAWFHGGQLSPTEYKSGDYRQFTAN